MKQLKFAMISLNWLLPIRDGIYGKWLKPFLREWYDIKHKRIPPACPFFNPYAERMVKTYKDEIFNNVIVFNQKDAENILTEYSALL